MRLFLICITVSLFTISESRSDVLNQASVGCSIDGILNPSKKSMIDGQKLTTPKCLKAKDKTIKISENIVSVEVLHEAHEVLIQRTVKEERQSCPPFCIQPLSIQGVTTVGELEALAFIEKLKETKAGLLIDVRTNKLYRESTIPSAINLPFSMLENHNIYQEEVLKLLGAKKIVNKKLPSQWYFKDTLTLLVFGQSATTNDASFVINKLIKLGYPNAKILYYRGGIASWKAMGLTTI